MRNYKLLLGDAGCITSLIRARRLDLLDALPATFHASSHTIAEATEWEKELGSNTTRLSDILHDFIFKKESSLFVSMAGRYVRTYFALDKVKYKGLYKKVCMQKKTPPQRERQIRATVVAMQFLGAESLLKLVKPFQHIDGPVADMGILYTDPYLPLIQERIRTQHGEEIAHACHFIPLAAYLGTLRNRGIISDEERERISHHIAPHFSQALFGNKPYEDIRRLLGLSYCTSAQRSRPMLEYLLNETEKKRATLEKFCRGEICKDDMLRETGCDMLTAVFDMANLRLEQTQFHPEDLAEEIRKSEAFFEAYLSRVCLQT